MALNIKNPHVERLAAEVAKLARESKTEAIGRALEERKARLASRVIRRDRRTEFLAFLQREIWPKVPRKYRRRRLTRKDKVRSTRGTDGHALVLLVPRDDYERMIALYLATKAWVLKSRAAGRR